MISKQHIELKVKEKTYLLLYNYLCSKNLHSNPLSEKQYIKFLLDQKENLDLSIKEVSDLIYIQVKDNNIKIFSFLTKLSWAGIKIYVGLPKNLK